MPSNLILFIDLAARSAIVLTIAWGVILAMPKLSAAARYWIWLTGLCALPLLPLSNTVFPSITLFDLSPTAEEVAENSLPPFFAEELPGAPVPEALDTTIAPINTPAVATGSSDPIPTAETPVPSAPVVTKPETAPLALIVGTAYAVGAGALLLPLVIGLLRLRRLRKRSLQPDAQMSGQIDRFFANRTEEQRPVVLISPDITIPLTWGTFRPVILLPENASEWSRSRLDVVLSHETAHIARRDFATGLAASVLRAAFWFQPLAWIAHRKLRLEREIACDDRVLQSSASTPPDYAQHLSEVVQGADNRHLVAGIAMARPSEIVGRVRAILDSARNRAGISLEAKQRTTLLALVILLPLIFVRCTGEKQGDGSEHKTSNGISLKAIDPKGITATIDGGEVEIPGVGEFHMATREVTQSEFQEVLGHNPSSTKAAHLPVDRVTRTEAASFCKVLTERDRAVEILPEGKIYRLPTQSEWLIAGLPGGLVPANEGLEAIAWHAENSTGLLHPVGAKEANAYGMHDMIGNAAEWVDADEVLAKELAEKTRGRFVGRVTLQLNFLRDEKFAGGKPDYKSMMQTQFAIIESRETLMPVAAELDLAKRWETNQEEVLQTLVKNLRSQDIRGTDLIEIRYAGRNREEAAEVANKVAESYHSRMNRLQAEAGARELEEYQEGVQAQQKLVDEARTQMLNLMKDSNIVDLGSGRPSWMAGDGKSMETGTDQIVMRSKLDEYAAKAEVEKLRTRINTLMNLDGDGIIKAGVSLGIESPTLTTRYPEYQTAILKKQSLLDSGLGESHPDVVPVQKQIEALRAMLVDEVKTIKESLGTRMEMAEKNLADSIARKKNSEEDSLNEKRRAIEYLAARDEYELHKTLLAEMKQRIATLSVNAKMPRSKITIHELASPPITPTRPQSGTPHAIGGTAFDSPDDLLDKASASGDDERADGVGFRFVMADE